MHEECPSFLRDTKHPSVCVKCYNVVSQFFLPLLHNELCVCVCVVYRKFVPKLSVDVWENLLHFGMCMVHYTLLSTG